MISALVVGLIGVVLLPELSAARSRSVSAARRELEGVVSREPYRSGTVLPERRVERVGVRSTQPLPARDPLEAPLTVAGGRLVRADPPVAALPVKPPESRVYPELLPRLEPVFEVPRAPYEPVDEVLRVDARPVYDGVVDLVPVVPLPV